MTDYKSINKQLKNKFKNREKIFGGWISFGHPSICETFINADFDFIAIDMEHSTISFNEAQRIIAASQSGGIPCLPRPVSHSNDWYKPLLDSGADGFFITTVNTEKDIKNIIDIVKYPPVGKRSYGLNRAQNYGFDAENYFNNWNDNSLIIIQIESIDAVNNIENLIAFDEIDGVMIGPYDLSGSLKVPGKIFHPTVIEASKKVIEACKKVGKSCGTQISDPNKESLNKLFNYGYTFAILGSDLFALWNWSQKMHELIKNDKS